MLYDKSSCNLDISSVTLHYGAMEIKSLFTACFVVKTNFIRQLMRVSTTNSSAQWPTRSICPGDPFIYIVSPANYVSRYIRRANTRKLEYNINYNILIMHISVSKYMLKCYTTLNVVHSVHLVPHFIQNILCIFHSQYLTTAMENVHILLFNKRALANRPYQENEEFTKDK